LGLTLGPETKLGGLESPQELITRHPSNKKTDTHRLFLDMNPPCIAVFLNARTARGERQSKTPLYGVLR
jgi:hypothetical protein